MRLQNYLLTEASYPTKKQILDQYPKLEKHVHGNIDLEEFYKVWAQVKKDCKPALGYIKEANRFIYRGMKGNKIGEKFTRTDRKPKDTDPIFHKIIDDVMEDLYDWRPRSEGLFCTGSTSATSSYGDAYIIFPVGKFEYFWSPHVYDSYSHFQTDRMIEKYIVKNSDKSSISELYDSIYGPKGTRGNKGYWSVYGPTLEVIGTFTNKEADTAEKAKELAKEKFKNTVSMVTWNPELESYQYVSKISTEGLNGVSLDSQVFKDIIEDLIDKQLKYQDTGMNKAILSGNEIIIRTPKYYYFEYYRYSPLFRYILGLS